MVRPAKNKAYFRDHWAILENKAGNNPKGMPRYAREAIKLAKEESKWSAAKAAEHLARFKIDHVKEQKKASFFDRLFRRNVPSFDSTFKQIDKKKVDHKHQAARLYRELEALLPKKDMPAAVYLHAIDWYLRYEKVADAKRDHFDWIISEIKRLDPPEKLTNAQLADLWKSWTKKHSEVTPLEIVNAKLPHAEKAVGAALLTLRKAWF